MCKSGCAVATPFSTLICLQLYDVVPPKYSKVVTQCVTLVTLLSHWLQLCEEQSHVTGDGRALAPKRQKPQKTGNHAAAGDRNPTGELDRNQTEITEIHQKSFLTSHPQTYSELGTPFNHGCFHKSIDYQTKNRKNKCRTLFGIVCSSSSRSDRFKWQF